MALRKSNGENLCSEHVFRDVFLSQFKTLRNYLLYRYRDAESADDIAQNAFVKLWENCGMILPEQARSFLFTTATRMSLNVLKHNKVVEGFALRSRRSESDVESPEFLILEDELRVRLEKALNNLPEKRRVVFMMNRFDNLSYAEIASHLGISVKTVEKRMHYALLEMRQIIQNI